MAAFSAAILSTCPISSAELADVERDKNDPTCRRVDPIRGDPRGNENILNEDEQQDTAACTCNRASSSVQANAAQDSSGERIEDQVLTEGRRYGGNPGACSSSAGAARMPATINTPKSLPPLKNKVPGPFGPGEEVPSFMMRTLLPGKTAAAAPK